MGLGVASGAAGLGLALSGQSENEQADDLSLPFHEAQSHKDKAQNEFLASYFLFGIAGAALVTSGILFYLGWEKYNPASASITFLPQGAFFSIRQDIW